MRLLKCAIRRSFFVEREFAEVGGRACGGEKEGLINEGVGFAILSDDGGCFVHF